MSRRIKKLARQLKALQAETGFSGEYLDEALRNTPRPLNPGRPDQEAQVQLELRQLPVTDEGRKGFPPGTPIQWFTLGECSIIVTFNHCKRWHLSIAHRTRNPTWHEISQARYRCLPKNIWVAMYMPPADEYINIHRFCFQMQQCDPPPEEVK